MASKTFNIAVGQLSSVNLIAAAGILGSVGGIPIAANANVLSSISSYSSLAPVAQFQSVKNSGSTVLDSPTLSSLYNLASGTFPALTDAVPSSYTSNLGSTPLNGFSSLVSTEINNIIGGGDLGKFDQVFTLADVYTVQTNMYINSAINANSNVAISTFSTSDNVITAGLSQVTLAFQAFGNDLLALGFAINLSALPDLGSPQSLLRQIYLRSGGSSELNTALLNAGIPVSVLDNISTVVMTDEQQKIAFEVMTKITGPALLQVLRLLKVTTRNLTSLADLLNPVKAFPLSFNTLTAPTTNGLRAIYVNSSGAVNTNLETELPPSVLAPIQGYGNVQNTYVQLKNIIPPDWALANKALQAGLEQVKSIFTSTTPLLGAASVNLETNIGLNLINALTSPLPASVSNYFSTTYAQGTGANGTILLTDVIGSAAGWNVTDNITNATSNISTLVSLGALNTLTNGTNGVYTVMLNTLGNVYGNIDSSITIPPGLPGAGTYANANVAFTGPGSPSGSGLIPAATSLIGTIVTNNSAAVANCNAAWSNIAAQLTLEKTLQPEALIVFANLIPGLQPTGLVNGLGQYGLDTAEGGAAWYLESVANLSTLGGQAIVSSMREARNKVRLQDAGIPDDTTVDASGTETSADLATGQYTAAQAAAQKII